MALQSATERITLQDVLQELGGDLELVERSLCTLTLPCGAVGASVSLTVGGRGKRLRPCCVILAARLGHARASCVRELAVAAELVHAATLLHDDVIDEGELRRGRPAARVVNGNAAAVLAGDWLLVEALRRVDRVGIAQVSERLRETLARMVDAEAIQLEQRGRVHADVALHDRIVAGKTVSLFAWGMFAGAAAAGVDDRTGEALQTWARHAGMAFQIVDDVLDFSGDPAVTGKGLFTDLAQGKLSYPLLLAVQRDPSLADALQRGTTATETIVAAVVQTGAIDAARERASRECRAAGEALRAVSASPARASLLELTEAIASRER